jgi:hypothetical protein
MHCILRSPLVAPIGGVMRKLSVIAAFGLMALEQPASALCTSYPNTLTNGTTADGGQVMANFNCAALTSGSTMNGVTFTGTTSFPGSTAVSSTGAIGIGMAPTNILDISQSQNGASSAWILNNNTGTSAQARFVTSNGTSNLVLGQLGQNYTSSGPYVSGRGYIEASTSLALIGYKGPVVFAPMHTEYGRFGTDGSLLVGTTTNGGWAGSFKFEAKSSTNAVSGYTTASSGGNALYARVDNTASHFAGFAYNGTEVGTITTNGSATSYNTTSDARLKDTAVIQRDYHDAIQKLWVGDFKWKKDGSAGFGIVAQQAYTVFPQAIQKPFKEADIWQADYSKLAPLALWGVKDLYKSEDARDQRITSLEGEVKRLHQANADVSAQIKELLTRVTALERHNGLKTASR